MRWPNMAMWLKRHEHRKQIDMGIGEYDRKVLAKEVLNYNGRNMAFRSRLVNTMSLGTIRSGL